jgi:hypothetical protein
MPEQNDHQKENSTPIPLAVQAMHQQGKQSVRQEEEDTESHFPGSIQTVDFEKSLTHRSTSAVALHFLE